MLQTNFTNTPNFADTRSSMDNIQDFNALIGNSIDNQMGIEDDVAVHATFGWNVAAFGICRIESGKSFNRIFYFPIVTFSLKVTKLIDAIVIDLRTTFEELITYHVRFARKFFSHRLNFFWCSSHVIKLPSSIRWKCSHHSSCVPWNGTLGFQLLGDDVPVETGHAPSLRPRYATAGSLAIIGSWFLGSISGSIYDINGKYVGAAGNGKISTPKASRNDFSFQYKLGKDEKGDYFMENFRADGIREPITDDSSKWRRS